MQILIETFTGSKIDGVVLYLGGTRIRAAIPGCDDILEFRYGGGQWFSEAGEPVEIRFYQAPDGDGGSDSLAGIGRIVSPGHAEAKAVRFN